jgi:large repetitive protein
MLVGIPRQAGSWSFWLELSDEDPPSQPLCIPRKSERRFTVDVLPGLAVTNASAPPATVGAPYSLPLSTEGSGMRTWSIASGRLPPGLTLNPASGEIAGSPTTAGVYDFRVRVNDGSRLGTKQLTIRVREPLAVPAPTVPLSEVGVPIAALMPVVTGGSATKTWQLEPALPRGLSFDVRSGAITGTPQVAGSFPVKLAVTDSEGRSAGAELTIVVSPRLTIAPKHLAPARAGRRYSSRVTALGGVGPMKFDVLTGRLPAEIRLNPRTGVLAGKPRAPGVYRIVVEARDALDAAARRTFVLTVVL